MPISPLDGTFEALRAEAFESSLHPRIIGRAGASKAASWRLIYLDQGKAELIDGAETLWLEAPCVLWQPWHIDTRLRINAGAMGIHVFLGSSILAGAIGHKPESPELRFMAERRAHIQLVDGSVVSHAVTQTLEVILDEANREAAAAHTVVEAALHIILIHLWRTQSLPRETENPVSTTRRLMSRFNNLVEVHFRQRWSLAQYAHALGITTDRLNDMCRRARGYTPRQVIATRIGAEARLLLENSLHSLDHVASELGFPSAAQFNRFFKSVHGIPPGQYRREHLLRGVKEPQNAAPEHFDWP
jgi:AraC family transcriptional activator of pobA